MASTGPRLAEPPIAMEGTLIEGYRIGRKLGAGGVGAVYEGTAEASGRRVAIKILHREFSDQRDVTLRFFNEARAVKVVGHPGLVDIQSCGEEEGGIAYMIMEFLQGETLSSMLKQWAGRLPLPKVIEVCRQAAETLVATHDKGIIHRDLKPDNLMILTDPAGTGGEVRVKVLDFGIAKLRPEHMAQEATIVRTQSGQLLGTPNYMAPEQCQSSIVQTEKVDVYALGTVMFRCLAGRTPFVTDGKGDAGLMHLCAQQIAEPPPPLRQFAPEIPEEVAELVATTLRKAPEQRPTMKQLAERLADLQKRGVGASLHRGSSDDLPTISQPVSGAAAGSSDRPSLAGLSFTGGTAKVLRKRRFKWWQVALGVVGLLWFAALLWWSLASPSP